MSITTADDRVTSYSPVVATTTFAADFPVFDDDDLVVIHGGVERTDFTVTASYVDGISNDAAVVFESGLVGDVLVVGRRAARRGSRFVNGAPLPIWQQNLAIDTLTAQTQENARDARHAVKLPITSPNEGYTILPGIAEGALLTIKDGAIGEGPNSETVFAAAEAAAEAAAASATQSDASATASAASAAASAVSAASSAESAEDAAIASDAAEALVIAATAGFAGFIDGMIYDFGSVADPITYFDQDWGTI